MCTTASCVPTTGCTITATTRTSTTTIGCPLVPAHTPWYTAGNQQVLINDLGAGTIIAMEPILREH
ncbi:hypothetical protein ONS96_013485 [Cadophora gregata f. sp. sojae]|nr:hypothetical protein ONS96_013485 [Cadophora gregata f. sp. sojae]